MSDKQGRLNSPQGRRLFAEFLHSIEREHMQPLMKKGIVIALSGGADSVLLLLLLKEYCEQIAQIPMTALHVHHGIRAAEADRDADFCRALCDRCGVPLIVEHRDAPAYAKERGIGLEEAARDVRYEALRSCLNAVQASYIVTAHHATDQLETVLFHMLRGSGTQGMCGMWPVTEDILRPMLSFTRGEILKCLETEKIVYMKDSTNDSGEYMRNYIRLNILPQLSHITASPERAITRLTRNLREDAQCLDSMAEEFFGNGQTPFSSDALAKLPKAIFARVLFRLAREYTAKHPEAVHVERIYALLQTSEPFFFCLPGSVVFVSDGKYAHIEYLNESRSKSLTFSEASHPLHEGMNDFPSYGFSLYVSKNNKTDISLNVYKISIQADLSSAIIKGTLTVRFRREGDAYAYGGMTHRVKRMLADRHISHEARRLLPVLCDECGIVWIPGFPVRQDVDGTKKGRGPYITFLAHDAFPDI